VQPTGAGELRRPRSVRRLSRSRTAARRQAGLLAGRPPLRRRAHARPTASRSRSYPATSSVCPPATLRLRPGPTRRDLAVSRSGGPGVVHDVGLDSFAGFCRILWTERVPDESTVRQPRASSTGRDGDRHDAGLDRDDRAGRRAVRALARRADCAAEWQPSHVRLLRLS
jgi:hypothetical protein